MVKIDEVARILGYGEEPTDSAKSEARIILKAFGVKGVDVLVTPGTFGKAAKQYDLEVVQDVAKEIAGFKAIHGF